MGNHCEKRKKNVFDSGSAIDRRAGSASLRIGPDFAWKMGPAYDGHGSDRHLEFDAYRYELWVRISWLHNHLIV